MSEDGDGGTAKSNPSEPRCQLDPVSKSMKNIMIARVTHLSAQKAISKERYVGFEVGTLVKYFDEIMQATSSLTASISFLFFVFRCR